MDRQWRRCSACKKPIELGALYWVCNVSTCNRKRTALAFCTVSCWEVHLPIARHRESWAVEQTAPLQPDPPPEVALSAASRSTSASSGARPASSGSSSAAGERPKRRIIPATPSGAGASAAASPGDSAPREILIIASRLKDYVRARSGFNTSDRVLDPLSDILRTVVDEVIENARADERKTILDRDVPKRPRGLG